MGPHVGRLARLRKHLLAGQDLEELEQPLGAETRPLKVGETGLIGSRLLGAAEAEHVGSGDAGAGPHDRHAGIAPAGHRGGRAQHHRQDLDRGRPLQLVLQARQMASADVAAFMSDHADDLARRL